MGLDRAAAAEQGRHRALFAKRTARRASPMPLVDNRRHLHAAASLAVGRKAASAARGEPGRPGSAALLVPPGGEGQARHAMRIPQAQARGRTHTGRPASSDRGHRQQTTSKLSAGPSTAARVLWAGACRQGRTTRSTVRRYAQQNAMPVNQRCRRRQPDRHHQVCFSRRFAVHRAGPCLRRWERITERTSNQHHMQTAYPGRCRAAARHGQSGTRASNP